MNTAPEIAYGIGTIVILAALIWGTVAYRHRNRALDAAGEHQAAALAHDTRRAPTTTPDNRWLVAVVCICAVILGGFGVYSYKLTGWMQQVASNNGTTAKGPDPGAFANQTTPPKQSNTSAAPAPASPSNGG